MTDARWTRLQALFDEALTLPASERDAWLDRACAGDTALRDEIDALLNADAEQTDGRRIASVRDLLDMDLKLEGTQLDSWRLIRRIGAGGMGSVFLAERADGGFEQTVALKVVRKGMDTEAVLRRFRMERQILARLNHAHIAGVLDGGVTADGRPYFVMEYVDGVPINEYCDRHRLTVQQRLSLFRTVCGAVHYAHQSLVIHRDLKPSNILVTESGAVKLLDFGVAKLLDDSSAIQATQTIAPMMTPAYAAPEHLLSEPVTTQTDVYALGVILYELLAGRRPYEVRRTADEFRQQILAADPARPSAVVTRVPLTTDGRHKVMTGAELGAVRRIRVERLQKLLRGDLDVICLAALRREPDKRYPSADQMAADVKRFLDGLPIAAQPDSLGYRVSKFLRRHTAGVSVAAAVFVLFLATVGFYTMRLATERDNALREQAKTGEVVRFVTSLFEVADPSESRGDEITARNLLDNGAVRVQYDLADRPAVQAKMMSVLGEVYLDLGSEDRARELLTQALDQQLALYGEQNLEVATTRILLGFLHQNIGENDAAGVLFDQARETRESLLGYEHHDVMEAISVQAFLEETRGDFDRALALHGEALALAGRLYSGDNANIAQGMTKLAGVYRLLDRLDEAEPLLRDALAMQQRLYGDRPHPEKADTMRQLAGLLRNERRFDESEQLYKAVIAARVAMFGENYLEVAHAWNSYSQMLSDKGDLDGAVAANRKFIDIVETIHHGPHPSLGAAYNNLAILMRDQGDLDGALEFLQRSIDMQDAVGMEPRHPNRSFPLTNVADIYRRQGRFAEAEPIVRDMLALRRENYPEDHRLVTDLKSLLGATLTGEQRYAEAEPLLLDAYQRFGATLGADNPRTRRASKYLVELYVASGDPGKADNYRLAAGMEEK